MATSAWAASAIIPTLGVDDLDAAVAHYEKLGFRESWRYPPGAASTHVGMDFGDVSIMLTVPCDGKAPTDRQNLYFVMKNLGSFHEGLRAVYGTDLPPMVESDYGMRDFVLTDPWGHVLAFGEEC